VVYVLLDRMPRACFWHDILPAKKVEKLPGFSMESVKGACHVAQIILMPIGVGKANLLIDK